MEIPELFVETIAKDAYVYAQQGKRKTLQRKDLDNAIEAIDEFAFLEGAGAVGRGDEQGNLFAERGCCRRQSRFLHVGHDVSGSPVSVDVGKCRSSCLSQRISSPHPDLLGLSRQSSMLDFLRSKKLQVRRPDSPLQPGAPRSCPAGSCCEPARVRVERLLLFEGVREVEVVEGCHCSTCPEECLRLPALKTFFPDSPWEVTVDVGKCSGPAYGADGLFCLPTKFNTALVKNPHGGEVVRTLESCEMKEKCYRVSRVEYYYEMVHSSAGRREERLKEIDVGRCLGSCSSGDPCLLGESPGGEKCLVWAEAAASRCAPHRYDVHVFRSRRDRVRTVVAIRQCKCRG
ncbi:PREDICTED: DNA polymerase epsilon subunit 4 [Nipponia nippon]|uniref:DNA polymerase epsilon subunit 4 n=1 Tax=Nipponia nippon TaxID=128390 RepID=UPI0005108F6A|nr:PREDICTED: DNA polymerase epsilon subunit 4 [Nipponia nippon]